MARIGKRIIEIPNGVEVKVTVDLITVKGPKGQLLQQYDPRIEIKIADGKISTICNSKDRKVMALHGLYNSLITNMVIGVSTGFEKKLEMVGVGYRAAMQGKSIALSLGFSHPVIIDAPAGIEIATEGANKIVIKGLDKQVVGEVAAKIRRVREVEPYKGKGVRYVGERVRKKAGKAAKVGAGA
ncbi:MAG: 50S ribosomal protein L6 [bacterium]